MNFLLVDDSIIIRTAIEKTLMEHPNARKFKFFNADNGKVALQVLKSNFIDLIFLDWNMPVMSGEDLINTMRETKAFNHVRIIMATTEGSKSQVIKMAKKGINGYLVKPFDKQGVIKVFDTVSARMH